MAMTDGVNYLVPAGQTVNLFLGRASEMPGGSQPLTQQLFMSCDSFGITASMNQNVGGTPLAPIQSGTPVNIDQGDSFGPKLSEDLMGTFTIPVGARQALNVTNANPAAVAVRYRNFITP